MKIYTYKEVLKVFQTHKRWYDKSYSGFLFPICIQGKGIADGPKLIPFAMPFGMVFQNHDRIEQWHWMWDEEFLEQRRAEVLKLVQADEKFAAKFYRTWEATYRDFLKYWQSIAKTDFKKLSPIEIRKVLEPLYRKVSHQASFGYVVDTFLNNTKEDWLEQIIRKELGPKATPEVIAELTAPVAETFVNDFELGKLQIARLIRDKASDTQIKSTAEKLAQEYFWIRTNYHVYPVLTAAEVLAEAKEEAKKLGVKLETKIHEEQSRTEKNLELKQKLIKKLKVSVGLQRILDISQTFTRIQDKRKEVVLRGNNLFLRGLDSFAKQSRTPDKLIFYLAPEEFFDLKQFSKIDWKRIADRRDHGALAVYADGACRILDRVTYEKLLPLKNFFHSTEGIVQVSGSVAFRGLVTGVARVVRNVKEIESFKTGEVLIANQTTPEYVPAMKKAAAFVTDQGGITCHAAIVAREMKKPCVIGTKNATNVFKDGDMVEVDANKGIVRKL